MRCLAMMLLSMSLLATSLTSWADQEEMRFHDPQQAAQYHHLLEEVRCLVCQNQSLAESHADLAKDLRLEIAQALQRGESPEQIKAMLVKRYGDFVLYRPPVRNTTLLLWFGPAVLLLCGLWVVWKQVQRQESPAP